MWLERWTVETLPGDLEGKEDSIEKWSRGHVCYTLAKNLSALCLCPETLCEAKFKDDGLVKLAEEISKQQNIQTAL